MSAVETVTDGPAFSRDELERAYRQHGHIVLRRARQLLGDEDAAWEALQQVFLSLADDPAQFRGRSSFVTFLYSATTHLCLNRLRDGRTRARLLDDRAARGESVATAQTQPADVQDLVELRRVLGRLPPDLAEVAVLHHLDGMTHDEVAHVVGCTRRQVGHLLDRLETFWNPRRPGAALERNR